MVEENVFYKANGILEKDKNFGKRYNKHNENYPLHGILFCEEHHKMTGSAPKGRTKRYPKYHCPTRKEKHTNYDIEDINNKFLAYIKDFKMGQSAKEALKIAIKLNLSDTIRNNEHEKENLMKRLSVIEREKKEIVRKNIRGVLPDKTTQEVISEYEKEETNIKLRIMK